jgi:hypothetical protein
VGYLDDRDKPQIRTSWEYSNATYRDLPWTP